MNDPRVKVAHLNSDALSKIQSLENDLGTYIVALDPQTPYANLSDDQLDRIAALEKELGVILLAYKRQS